MKIQKRTNIEKHAFSINLGLFLLRSSTVCLLVYFEIWIHLGKAWKNIWNQEPWGLAEQLQSMDFPLAQAVSVVIILGAFLVSVAIFLGFLCRINATVLIIILSVLLATTVKTSDNLTAETIVLYVIVLTSLIIAGPGVWSVDHYLAKQRHRRKA